MTTTTHKNLGLAYSVRGLVHYQHGGNMATGSQTVLEKSLRVLHPDPQAEGRESDTGLGMGF